MHAGAIAHGTRSCQTRTPATFFFWSDKKGGSSAPSEPPLATCLARPWFTVTMRPGGDWASRCRRSENRSTSRGQAKNFRICLMTTKVVSSTKPLARSVKVQSLTLLTLSCQGITKTTTRSGSAVSPKKKKKKKLEATKGPTQSAFEPTTIRGSKVSRLYRPGYIGIDDCVVKKNPWNHGHRHGVLDSRSGKSVWCAFDKT